MTYCMPDDEGEPVMMLDEFHPGFHASMCCCCFCAWYTTLAKDSRHAGVFLVVIVAVPPF